MSQNALKVQNAYKAQRCGKTKVKEPKSEANDSIFEGN